MKYIDTEVAIAVHDFVIEQTGGLSGVRNINLLASPLDLIKNDVFYCDLAKKVCFLLFSIVKNHPFADGNKRSAVAICAAFLSINGYDDDRVGLFVAWAELAALSIAANQMSLSEIEQSFELWNF